MQQVFRELTRRKVRPELLTTLEVFGGSGNLHTKDYVSQVSTLEVWDIDPKNEETLKRNFPMAEVKITDSYKEIKSTPGKYDLIVIDNPISTFGGHCEHFDLFPDIFRVAKDSAILILDVIPEINDVARKKYPNLFNETQLTHRKSFYQTNRPERVSFNQMIEVYKNMIVDSGFNLEWYFFQKRTYPAHYLVLKIKKSGA